ncbi:MAG: GNAT family N-acetyltransferase, partial [Pseudomonadota bacterium]
TRHAPYAGLGTFDDFDAYHKTLTSKTRKNLRNYRNRLMRTGDLRHEVVSDPEAKGELTVRCLQWRTTWLAQCGLSSTAFQHPAFPDLISALGYGKDAAPQLQVMRLTLQVDGNPSTTELAIQWGFVHAGRYYAFMSAKNPDFDKFSPGRLHLEDVVRESAAAGLDVVDFLVPDMPYKATFATGRIAVDSYGIAATLKGRAVVDGWHGAARPLLKAAFHRLPKGLRRAATDLDLRMQSKDKD